MVQPPSTFMSSGSGVSDVGGGSVGSLVACPHPPVQVTFNLGGENTWDFESQVLNIDIKEFFAMACQCIEVALEDTENPTYALQCVSGVMTRVLNRVYAASPIAGTGTSGDPLTLNLDMTTGAGDNPLRINANGLYLDPKFFAALLCQCIPVVAEDTARPAYSIQCLADGTMVRVLETVDSFVTWIENADGSLTLISNDTANQVTILPDTNISWTVAGDLITLIDPDGPQVVVSSGPDDDTWISFVQNPNGSWTFTSPDGLNAMTIPAMVVDTDTRIAFSGDAIVGWTFTDPVTNQVLTISPHTVDTDTRIAFGGNSTVGWSFTDPVTNQLMTIPPYPVVGANHDPVTVVNNDIAPWTTDADAFIVTDVTLVGQELTLNRIPRPTMVAANLVLPNIPYTVPVVSGSVMQSGSFTLTNPSSIQSAWAMFHLNWGFTFFSMAIDETAPSIVDYEFSIDGGVTWEIVGTGASDNLNVDPDQTHESSPDGTAFTTSIALAAGGSATIDVRKILSSQGGTGHDAIYLGKCFLSGAVFVL